MASQPLDPLLESFLVAADEAESQELLARLMSEVAEPIIRNIITNKLRTSPAFEDVYSSIHLQLLARLGNLKINFHDSAIRNFRSYVSAMAYNGCNEYLRQKYPQRHSLKNRLRYVLTHDSSFRVWGNDEHHLNCSLAVWTNQVADLNGSRRLRELREDPQAFIEEELPHVEVQHVELGVLLRTIFKRVGVPIKLDELVVVVVELLGIKDRLIESTEVSDLSEAVAASDVSFATGIERREFLRHLWTEIVQLPPRQRAALLLNLRDTEGRDVITFFPLTRTASIRQIADALDIPVAEFAELWRSLPLDDAAIAERLGATRQQVINLRKAARKRLARRQQNLMSDML